MTRRTYSHLATGRMPSDYEVVSTDLLYYPRLGLSVDNPVTAFQAQHRSELIVPEAGSFADPRATTYTTYVELARRRETFVSELFSRTDAAYEERLPAPWLALLERVFAPLRYPCHGLMLLTSYLGSTATDSRRVIALALSAGDELRRVHRFAERLGMLRRARPALGERSREAWQEDAAFQPLRELMERTLVTYDVSSAWLASELALKPAFDDFVYVALATAAEGHHDSVLTGLLGSLAEDARWHADANERWLCYLLTVPSNRELVARRVEQDLERAERALSPLVELVGGGEPYARARRAHRTRLAALCAGEAT